MHKRSYGVFFTFSLVAAGCGYGDHDRHVADEEPGLGASNVVVSTIDTDATLEGITPGEGTGVYIDYASDGSWGVYASCDTDLSGDWCEWDVIAVPLTGQVSYEADLLELHDYLAWTRGDGVRMVTDTTDDLDGFILYADPGVVVRFDILLDGMSGQRYVYWVGDGAVHAGAPTNPIDLVPAED